MTKYSQVDMLGLRYISVNFGVEKSRAHQTGQTKQGFARTLNARGEGAANLVRERGRLAGGAARQDARGPARYPAPQMQFIGHPSEQFFATRVPRPFEEEREQFSRARPRKLLGASGHAAGWHHGALSRSILSRQFGEARHWLAPKLTDVCRTPRVST